ncbi:acetyltransferase [Terrabacter sp. NPDC080008]|uniref:acetyltransferase n=1 Tax=Terrabacter sp. NPDC080008 TaxID=3155176 RepID=UPI00344D59DD
MPDTTVVLRDDDERYPHLLRDGWTVTARSWAARLDITPARVSAWRASADRLPPHDTCRGLGAADVPAMLELDAATAGDYPGSVATAHEPLTEGRACPTPARRAFGVLDTDGRLVALTFVDVDGRKAEVDFTVVAPDRRGQGLAVAVKAASLLALARDGVTVVRTGGSADNGRILAANVALGFRVDEHWLTLTAPETRTGGVEAAHAPQPR